MNEKSPQNNYASTVSNPSPPPGGQANSNPDVNAQPILLIGSFMTLLVVFLVIALVAFFHHYRHEMVRTRMAGIGHWAAQVKARQESRLAPHWVSVKHQRATVGIQLAQRIVLADYTPGAAPVLLPAPSVTRTAAAPMATRPSVPLSVLGETLYHSMGCDGCHTVNGRPGAGPTWKNLAGYPQHLTNGETKIADYSFLKFMILHPGKLVVKGFPPIMPNIYYSRLAGPRHPHLTKLHAIIWYINTLSNRSSRATRPPVPNKPAN